MVHGTIIDMDAFGLLASTPSDKLFTVRYPNHVYLPIPSELSQTTRFYGSRYVYINSVSEHTVFIIMAPTGEIRSVMESVKSTSKPSNFSMSSETQWNRYYTDGKISAYHEYGGYYTFIPTYSDWFNNIKNENPDYTVNTTFTYGGYWVEERNYVTQIESQYNISIPTGNTIYFDAYVIYKFKDDIDLTKIHFQNSSGVLFNAKCLIFAIQIPEWPG